MKRYGFTLAEVLVTLGIIGVVAALTTPALIQNVGNAKVGPKLQKAKATIETAAEMMLVENSANTITSITSNGAELGRELSNYMKITRNAQNIGYTQYKSAIATDLEEGGWSRFDSEDGITYWILTNLRRRAVDTDNYVDIPNNQYIGAIWVDINGAEGPNQEARDVFRFALYNDGTMRPWGGHGYYRSSVSDSVNRGIWSDNENCTDEGTREPLTCNGSIFENGMKIIYQ